MRTKALLFAAVLLGCGSQPSPGNTAEKKQTPEAEASTLSTPKETPKPTAPAPSPAPPADPGRPAPGPYKVEPLSPDAVTGVQEEGESFEAPEGSDKPNPLRWTTSSGDVLTVGVLFHIDDETFEGTGKYIAIVDGKRQPLASFDFNPAYSSFGYATVLSGEEVLFKGGDTGGSGDPGHTDAYLYRWNPSTKKLEEQKKWQGDGTQEEPAWSKDPGGR